MAQESTTEELLAWVAKRDEGALGELYDRFAPRLLGMLVQILSKREAAEEVLLQVFQRLWTDARRHAAGPESVGVWLLLAARLGAIERLRAERKLPTLPRACTDTLGKSFAWLPRAELVALLDGRREFLQKVLGQLPKHQREALRLAVFEGYTEQEISQQLAEPLAKVKTELRAAMTFFRHRLRAVLGTWAANI
jgi:RNA polymerase sigma-70 factor (ECF subfamily)